MASSQTSILQYFILVITVSEWHIFFIFLQYRVLFDMEEGRWCCWHKASPNCNCSGANNSKTNIFQKKIHTPTTYWHYCAMLKKKKEKNKTRNPLLCLKHCIKIKLFTSLHPKYYSFQVVCILYIHFHYGCQYWKEWTR